VLTTDPGLVNHVAEMSRQGKPLLAISSGYERLIEVLESNITQHRNHVSEFKNLGGVVGYVNSDLVLPELRSLNQSLVTLFHGPVLAKNPDLADKIIDDAGWCDTSMKNAQLESIMNLAEISRRVAFED
jgi:CobQ-like glutamine amidotransferase family enzyme